MADSTAAPAADAAPAATGRPVLPDVNAFNENVKKLEDSRQETLAKLAAIKEKIALVNPNKNKDEPTPTQKRRDELRAQLAEIRQQQAGGKSSRSAKLAEVQRLEEKLRSRIAELNTARGKTPFKNLDDLNREIDRLESEVNSGRMALVKEKQNLAEISKLRKQGKNFAQFGEQQAQIDELKAKIEQLRNEMKDPQVKELSERYNKIQAELDRIKAQEDEARKGLNGLRDERTKLQAEQDEQWNALKKVKDEYFTQKKAYDAYEREQRNRAWEKKQAERERYVQEKRMERAKKMLAEASDPAYLDEIRRAESLLHFFDPTQKAPEKTPLLANKGLGAQPQRKVDATGIKGVPLTRKEDREDEYLPAAKKGKKGKKSGAADSTPKNFNCPPAVIEDCAFMGIDPPMSAADVPAAIEKVKAKLEHWKADQAEQTRKNIEKAKKEIERLEAEEASGGAASPNGKAVNGKDDKAVAEATEAVEKVSVEEKEDAAA
ncbi:hypothetical protein QBC47DRAFT_197178 [Echria macrotheca]|uniref:Nuclear segregation protein n=1 Tax=Echria macrotheca TaxID=438768 RepID=A0AAJ0BD30_9PEZI|nr:hypothetical protein QBC47DRAFT_197178 [Echria macrotheca]